MSEPKVKKIHAGSYEVSDGNFKVRVFDASRELGGSPKWIAAAEWDMSLYTDWLKTKSDAIFNAKNMIEEARKEEDRGKEKTA